MDRAILINLINNIPHAIFWKDTDFVFRGCNLQFAKQFGYSSPAEIIGKTDYDLPFPGHLVQQYRQDDQRVIEKGLAKLNYEEVQVQPDCSERIVSVSKVPFYEDNSIIGIIGIYTDITQRKEEEKQLRVAKERVEATNYLMTEFISNIGHDLATPISDVGGIAQLLYYYVEEYPELKELFDTLLERSMVCEKVRRTILNATSISNLDVKLETFSIVSQLLVLEKELRPTIGSKNLQIILHPLKSKKEDIIKTDRIKFHDILWDLLSNAINFTQEGQIVISVERQGEYFHIKIADTGIGIPADKYEYIFQQYTKLSRSNQYGMNFKGVGAGLYLARIRANILHAIISVDSEVNKGSTFTLSIPVCPITTELL